MATATADAPPKTSDSSGSKDSDSVIKYEYMYEKDRSPTKQFDAILRAIAKHISCELGDKNDPELKPKKLAAFYKAVGGDYDVLFVKRDYPSISFMWQITGCQHSLQPTDNDFEPPGIPSLTVRGFSRWEALETLLGPDEHVPFIQFAVKNWGLCHPDTGEPFPPDLPRDVFPLVADPDVNSWHEQCADRLWKAADAEAPPAQEQPRTKSRSPTQETEPKYAHVPPGSHAYPPSARHQRPAESRSDTRPSTRARPMAYAHVPSRDHPGQRMGTRSPERTYRTQPEDIGRRRSFEGFTSPVHNHASPAQGPFGTYLDPNPRHPPQPRRHSHPREPSSGSSDDEPDSPQPVRRREPNNRRVPVAPQPPPAVNGRLRGELPRESELKRRSGNSPRGSLRERVTDKVSSVFGSSSRSSDRPRMDSRHNSYAEPQSPRVRRSPQRAHSTRVRPAPVAAHVESESESTSEDEADAEPPSRRRQLQEDQTREKQYYKDRDRVRPYVLDRELDDDLDHRNSRRPRPYVKRPEPYRRTSSHADVDRHRDQGVTFDPRGRDRHRDERRRYERRSPDDRGSTSPVTGVGGRRYPAEAIYT